MFDSLSLCVDKLPESWAQWKSSTEAALATLKQHTQLISWSQII